jgi:hypothetical protein
MLRSASLSTVLSESISSGVAFALLYSFPGGALVAYAGPSIDPATAKMVAVIASSAADDTSEDVMIQYEVRGLKKIMWKDWNLYIGKCVKGLVLCVGADRDVLPGMLRLKLRTLSAYFQEPLQSIGWDR